MGEFRERRENDDMDDFVQLLDLTSGDVVADFASEAEAIAALKSVLNEYGDESVEELALLRFRGDRPSLIAMEKRLVRYVTDAFATTSSEDVHQLPAPRFGNVATKYFTTYEPRVGRVPFRESWSRAFQLHRAISDSLTIAQTHVRLERLGGGSWSRTAQKTTATTLMDLDCVA